LAQTLDLDVAAVVVAQVAAAVAVVAPWQVQMVMVDSHPDVSLMPEA
jgi:hypothetical protein